MKRAFIIGCPRSGTTWTAMLLGQHPQVQTLKQIGALYSLKQLEQWWLKGEQKTETRYVSSALRFVDDGAGGARPSFDALMTRGDFVSICRGMLDDVYALAASKKPGCSVVLDTTPENIRTPELMAELMPDAYYLHIIRDPRAVYVSHRHGTKDFGALFPTDPAGSARFWRADVLRGRKLASLVPNYRELRYRDLKHNGPAELASLFSWFGLPADPAWCASVIANTTVEKVKNTPGTPKAFFRSGEPEGWRKEITPKQLRAVEFYAGDLMEELGYPREHPRARTEPATMAARRAIERFVNGVRGAMRKRPRRAAAISP